MTRVYSNGGKDFRPSYSSYFKEAYLDSSGNNMYIKKISKCFKSIFHVKNTG